MLSVSREKTQESIRSVQNDKSPGNEGYKKQFYEMIWNLTKETYVGSAQKARVQKQISTSQGQAIIQLIEKKDMDKECIKH